MNYLSLKKINFVNHDTHIVLNNNSETISALISLRQIMLLYINVISENIQNADQTRSMNSQPYKKRIPTLNKSGEVIIKQDNITPFRLFYDPTHPDAIRSGPKRGYVQYPNIHIVSEITELTEYQRLLNQIDRILSKFDPDIILIDNIE
ncbi:MAG: hypothetical protein OEZ34_10245 [Spirochaetia bacterium]|nr:hypothetical protein [Spirochaetia bacterium]